MTEHMDAFEAEFGPEEQQGVHLTNEMFQRRLVWDVVPCGLAPGVIAAMGLPPVSEEVEEAEHTNAHERLAALGPLDITANALAYHIARIQIEAITQSSPESSVLLEGLYPILSAAVKGVLAEMQDLNLIHQPHLMFPILVVEPGEVDPHAE